MQLGGTLSPDKKENHLRKSQVVFWRSERDLNPRAAFDGLLP